MEAARKRKVFGIVMRIVFFLVLFFAFFGLYHSPFSYFNDSYGLLKGPKEHIVIQNFISILDFVYIKSINCLYLFLGEKPEVMTGYHIFLRMVNSLLLFFSIEKIKKPVLSLIFTLAYGIYPFVIYEIYNYDGILIGEFFGLLLLFFVSSVIQAVVNAIVTRKRQKNMIPYREESTQWKVEEQAAVQEPFKGKEAAGEVLQVEKTGEQMKQNEMVSGNMEKEKIVQERDGVPNFLELTDEEIRRNAMIAAGLLSPEAEKEANPGLDKKKKEKKKSLFHKNAAEQPVDAKSIETVGKPKETEWANQQEKPMTHTQFIENPLPVPKRHVKKEMDYEYQVPEEQMHYDIEEPDKNYFDVV
ncbi:MAG: hypothetical protein NC412_15010 [Roseburia sp.]|nr:hypothetical protein [Roseburia sp.]MCM1280040.1 hypothetical protein [Robinsoniella sp.]